MEEEEEGEGEGEGLRPGSRCGLDRHLHRARACCRLDSPVVPSRAHLPTPGLAPAALGKALLTCPCPWPCPLVDSYMTAFPGLAPLRDQRQPRSIPSGLQEGAGLLATPGPSSRTQSCLSNHLQDSDSQATPPTFIPFGSATAFGAQSQSHAQTCTCHAASSVQAGWPPKPGFLALKPQRSCLREGNLPDSGSTI